nr:MAG TPA: hypothetical protein [Caudoviricetes sp.]
MTTAATVCLFRIENLQIFALIRTDYNTIFTID